MRPVFALVWLGVTLASLGLAAAEIGAKCLGLTRLPVGAGAGGGRGEVRFGFCRFRFRGLGHVWDLRLWRAWCQ